MKARQPSTNQRAFTLYRFDKIDERIEDIDTVQARLDALEISNPAVLPADAPAAALDERFPGAVTEVNPV